MLISICVYTHHIIAINTSMKQQPINLFLLLRAVNRTHK
ncbi:hypothetical protein AB07_4075 [Citrobacter freundii]|nr:hypothetical protein AB07_4075 [Citrobacter freundii]